MAVFVLLVTGISIECPYVSLFSVIPAEAGVTNRTNVARLVSPDCSEPTSARYYAAPINCPPLREQHRRDWLRAIFELLHRSTGDLSGWRIRRGNTR